MRLSAAGLLLAFAFAPPDASAQDADGRAVFGEPRAPPAYRALNAAEREAFELGQAVFNTQWVVAGTPRAGRRDGLGPVFNAPSCDACHNNGARAQGAQDSGAPPVGLVVQLARDGGPTAEYGHVLNPLAVDGVAAEGRVRVHYSERAGRYPDGSAWRVRVPEYRVEAWRAAPPPPDTLIRPRLAPPVFGAGLLDAVPDAAIAAPGEASSGRFGWQADSPSLLDQTARALSREMGLRSTAMPLDDCGARNVPCLAAAHGGAPEISDDFMAALLTFQRLLAVPRAADAGLRADEAAGAARFDALGCAVCHRPALPVEGLAPLRRIRAYTDLRTHDLGEALADRDLRGRAAQSRWRTAPLWGLGHADRAGRIAFLLHDGRARSIEEAVLWHGGEASAARARFMHLDAPRRQALLDWLARR